MDYRFLIPELNFEIQNFKINGGTCFCTSCFRIATYALQVFAHFFTKLVQNLYAYAGTRLTTTINH